MKTLFVTYHSDLGTSTFYKDCAHKLEAKIESLGGRIFVEEGRNLGSYAANCLIKPKFIRSCLQRYNEPIIWIDADSIVNELPIEMEGLDVDVACVEKANGCPESALIYFNNTLPSIEFINRWVVGCSTDKPELDHPVLKEMWFGESKGESRKSLSDSICSVRDDSKIKIILSNTVGKREITKQVMDRRAKEGKIQ